jgi:hypothetical protein
LVALPQTKEDEKVVDADGPRLRLLLCKTCQSIDELPWFDGPPEYDDTLNSRLLEHRYPDGNPHFMPSMGGIATVNQNSWEDPSRRREIIAQLSKAQNSTELGLGDQLYHARDNFKEDALKCWREHNRTTNCQDYRSPRKKLVPDSIDVRKELGLTTRHSARPGTSLCAFCPYHSIVMQRANKERGFY